MPLHSHAALMRLMRLMSSLLKPAPRFLTFQKFQVARLSSNNLSHPTSKDSPIPSPPSIVTLKTPEDWAAARSWVTRFENQKIPKLLVNLTFSRSSGPGGQNVNKVNTKATLRCSADADWIPLWARPDITKSPAYVSSTKSIMITSTRYRSQAENIEDCLSKLHALVLSASTSSIKNETPEETKKRVANHQFLEKERNKKQKSRRSNVKTTRGKPKGWD